MATSFAVIDIGTRANSKDGDTLRTAFQKINLNFNAIDALIQQYFEDFLETENQLPTNIKPITPNTNVTIESTGTGIITITAPLVSINGETEIRGNLEIAGELNVDNLVGTTIDCGKF